MAKDTKNANETPDFSTFVDEQIGYAPYWTPNEGKQFYARLMVKDARDPKFIRYIFQNMGETLECYTGPSDQAESVPCEKGDNFSISAYAQTAETFDTYLECGLQVAMLVTAVRQVKVEKGEMWVWRVQLAPDTKAMVVKARAELAAKRKNELTA